MRRLFTRALLLAFPREFRERLGRPMIQTLEADSLRPDGRTSLRRLVGGAADVIRSGLSERLRRHRAQTGASPEGSRAPALQAAAADLRAAWRGLRHRPIHASAVVGTLAVGLGATTAMFAVVDAVLVRPLPYPDDRALVLVGERDAARGLTGSSLPGLADYLQFPELASAGAFEDQQLLFRGDEPERVAGVSVSPGFFHTLGVAPQLGTVMPADGPLLDPDRKIVLGHDVWQRQFGGDASVIGRAVQLERHTYTVIGVMPPGFSFPAGAGFWTTLPPDMKMLVGERSLRFLEVIARLAPGSTLDQLTARMQEWSARTGTTALPSAAGGTWLPYATSLRDEVIGSVRPGLMAAFAGVGLLLAIACANAMALVLANGRLRLNDYAIQRALGAGRARLARTIVLEGLLLALAGAAAAVVTARGASSAIVELGADQIPRIDGIATGGRTMLFAIAAALLSSLLITAAPAWLLTRPNAQAGAPAAARTAAGSRGGRRIFGALVAIEFALALVLTSGAGLLLASYQRLRAVETGVASGQVLTMRVNLPLAPPWTGDDAPRRLYEDLMARIGALPGVTHASVGGRLPFDPARGGLDAWRPDRPGLKVRSLMSPATEGFLASIGARLVAGRDFAPTDTGAAPAVIIVNEELARALWPGEDAVGRAITYQFFSGPVEATVIGIAGSIRYDGPRGEARPEYFVPFRQARVMPGTFLVRTAGVDPIALVPQIRAVLRDVEPTRSVTLDRFATLDDRIARSYARPRFFLVLFGAFAVSAFLLAAFGIYGTMTFWIGERWRELGIRLALGATRERVVAHVVGRGAVVAGIGLALGLLATLVAGRMISALLFGVTASDPATLAASATALALVAMTACLVPARRISRLDPSSALRE